MPAKLMYGKPVAEQIENCVRLGVEALKRTHHLTPQLDVVLVGKSLASQRYVKKKLEACERLGMTACLHNFDESVSARELRECVERLSADQRVHGILVQLPLPDAVEEPARGQIGKFEIFDAIRAEKDVDGVSRHTVPELYRALQQDMLFLPATALAVRRMLAFYGIETQGKTAVVVGRNDITAKPVHHMLGGRMCNATAIWCHRYTPREHHDAFMRMADIIVTSVGSEAYRLTGDIVKSGAVVIDIGTRVGPDARLRGDADMPSVSAVASYLTPVPGGVGPVTVAALTENVLRAAQFAAGAGRRGYEF